MQNDEVTPDMVGQEAITVSPEMLLNQIVSFIGPEFVVMPTDGWMSVVETIQASSDEDILEQLNDLGVPVIPVSLAPKEEESRILTPNGIPAGDSRIIMP